jgi:hypothetical protein
MYPVVLLVMGLVAAGGVSEYTRALDAKKLDQAAFDAEAFGEKKKLERKDDGLHLSLAPGEPETGWKTPQQLRVGGDFTITATLQIKKLPKPAQEDGAAVGLAIATQDISQPDVTMVRLREPNGSDVYRTIIKESLSNQMMGMPGMMMNRRMMMMNQQQIPGGKPPKPPRPTFAATGELVRLELEREGNTLRFQVTDLKTGRPRYLGQMDVPPMDVTAIKLFATNRNGAEPLEVVFRDIVIRADRLSGLGTIIRTVLDEVVYGEPTAIENGVLMVGGPSAAGAPGVNMPQPGMMMNAAGRPRAVNRVARPAMVVAAPVAPAVAAPAAPAAKAGAAVKPAAPAVPPAQLEAVLAFGPSNLIDSVSAFAPLPAAEGATNKTPAPAQPAAPPPKAKIPLDELESIHFERTPVMAARFIGQPNLDFTMPGLSAKKPEPSKEEAKPGADAKGVDVKKEAAKPQADARKADAKPAEVAKAGVAKEAVAKKAAAPAKAEEKKKTDGSDDVLAPPPGTAEVTNFPKVEPKKNGIRDLQITLFGLQDAPIKQVTINCQTDGGPTTWQLDTTGTQAWPLVVKRSGTEVWADLFLEPPPGDCHDKDFTIMVMYENGQNGNAQAKATEHTKPDLAIDPKAPGAMSMGAWVYLANDEKLYGTFEGFTQEHVELTTPWQDRVKIPLMRVAGVQFGPLERKETPDSFARRLKARGSEDLLLAQAKNGEVIAIAGLLEGTEDSKLRFQFQGKTRSLPLKQVEGIVMAARPESEKVADLNPAFRLPAGVVVSGKWKSLDATAWKIETAWGQELKLPAGDIQGVRFRDGRMTYLSEMIPVKVEETAFFGNRKPYRRNTNLVGEPIKIKGQTYDRGIAVHSRSVLTYDLNRHYSKFEALVGFDDAAKYQGRADCRIFADDKEVFANPDLRASDAPAKLSVSVAGADQLRLVVDFGRGQDAGDRVIWANPRLYRQPAAAQARAAQSAPVEPSTTTVKK